MKKNLLFMGLLITLLFSSVNAQEINQGLKNEDVPAQVKARFLKLYPSVKNIDWSLEDGKYEGKFNYNKQSMSVQITPKGKLVQKETYLKISELPKAVQDYLAKNYAGVDFEKASKKTDAKGILFYQAETKEKTLLFNSKGKFIKEEKE